jgi:hypothetical protein
MIKVDVKVKCNKYLDIEGVQCARRWMTASSRVGERRENERAHIDIVNIQLFCNVQYWKTQEWRWQGSPFQELKTQD